MELPRLREWRESRGLMQKEVAKTAGVSEWTVLRAEGGASVRTPTARKIADALGVSVSDLLESPPVPLASAPPASPPLDVEAAEAGRRSVDYRKLYFDLGDRLLDKLDQTLAMIDEVLTTEDYAEFIKLPADEQHWRIETAERLQELARELIESLEEDPGAVVRTNAQQDELAERRRRLGVVGAVAEEFRRTA